MKKIILVAIVAVVLMIGAYGVYFFIDRLGQEMYINEELGFKLAYFEKRWHIADDEEITKLNSQKRDNDLKIQDAIINNGDMVTVLGIITQSVPGAKGFNRDNSIKQMDKQNEHRHNSFEKISFKEFEFLGYPAIEYECKYGFIKQFQGSEEYRRERQIIFLAGETIYRLIFSSAPESYESNRKDFDKMLKSFRVIGD